MTDLVERLRAQTRMGELLLGTRALCQEAADEIERLRKENTAMKQALGYPVPADEEVVDNPFKCGTCDAMRKEVDALRFRGERGWP